MAKRLGPALLALYAVFAGATALLRPPAVVGAICVSPLVLLAPGYALVMALRIRPRRDLPFRRLMLSVALSLATTVLGGLLINAVARLTTTSWAVWLVGFTCVCVCVALVRGPWQSDSSTEPEARTLVPRPKGIFGPKPVAIGVLVILLMAASVILTEVNSRRAYNLPVTQLSLLPLPGSSGRKLQLAVTNLSKVQERLTLTLTPARGHSTTAALSIPASHTWTDEELAPSLGLTAALTRPSQAAPFSEVTWRGPPVNRPKQTVRAVRRKSRRARRARSRTR